MSLGVQLSMIGRDDGDALGSVDGPELRDGSSDGWSDGDTLPVGTKLGSEEGTLADGPKEGTLEGTELTLGRSLGISLGIRLPLGLRLGIEDGSTLADGLVDVSFDVGNVLGDTLWLGLVDGRELPDGLRLTVVGPADMEGSADGVIGRVVRVPGGGVPGGEVGVPGGGVGVPGGFDGVFVGPVLGSELALGTPVGL